MNLFFRTIAFLSIIAPVCFHGSDISVNQSYVIDFSKVFESSPLIYGFLTFLSVSSLSIWIYTLMTMRKNSLLTRSKLESLKTFLVQKQFDQASDFCKKNPSILSSLIETGIRNRIFGPLVMIDTIKSEGKRISTPLWQKLSLLNEIAVLAPMIGLLGTVLGMFYAFYDVNRSTESINTLFDGLGVAVGTTVFGLIVAILAMLFSSTLKFRLIKSFTQIENESLLLSTLLLPEAK